MIDISVLNKYNICNSTPNNTRVDFALNIIPDLKRSHSKLYLRNENLTGVGYKRITGFYFLLRYGNVCSTQICLGFSRVKKKRMADGYINIITTENAVS